MELRHLRCFLALAEELHFTRAAECLHIEQSPLSRTIKELEDELGTLLFDRDRRGTRLTPAGSVFNQEIRHLFVTLEQACDKAKAVSAGFIGRLRVVVSDGAFNSRLSEFLAHCREEEPEIEIRLVETPLAEQLRGLRSGDFNIGFAHNADVGNGIVAIPVWNDPLMLAVPIRHPLLVHKEVPLNELAHYPLVLCDPHTCEGYCRELARILRPLERAPDIVEHAASLDMMLTLVAAGYGVGFTTAARIAVCLRPDIVLRPIATEKAVLTTYVLRLDDDRMSTTLSRFTARLQAHMEE
jgi:DNA-binding transcriptional LysR family regulator